jgi:hypothetical protein
VVVEGNTNTEKTQQRIDFNWFLLAEACVLPPFENLGMLWVTSGG